MYSICAWQWELYGIYLHSFVTPTGYIHVDRYVCVHVGVCECMHQFSKHVYIKDLQPTALVLKAGQVSCAQCVTCIRIGGYGLNSHFF